MISVGVLLILTGIVWAAITTIPASALVSSTSLYTDQIGGGLGSVVMSPNDDGSTGLINFVTGGASSPFTLNFFGSNYSGFYVNNNGNVTFNSPVSAYAPTGPTGVSVPIISAFFGDVDTRGTGSVYVRTDVPNEMIVTWNNVGYFSRGADRVDNFQIVLRGPGYNIPAGEGAIGFFYTTMQWEITGSQGGNTAAVGFGDGAGNGATLQGSLLPGIASTVQNHHIWFTLAGGVPTATAPSTSVPTLGTTGLVILGVMVLAIGLWFRRREAQA